MTAINSKTILTEAELGLSPFAAESSDPAVADVDVTPGGRGLTVFAKGADGAATLTVRDYWGYTATVAVKVRDRAVTVTGLQPFSNPKVLNARLHGAMCDGETNDSAAIQSMVDSLPEGGEILFPAGVYILQKLNLTSGISLRLQGNSKAYLKQGYTDELKAKVESGTEFAVLQASKNSRNNIIVNHDPGTGSNRLPGDWEHSASNLTMEGGMVDLHFFIPSGEQIDVGAFSNNAGGGNSSPATSSEYYAGTNKNNTCAIAFSCGRNILVDGVIFKDNYNGHAMQLCAVQDTVVKDCIFAGFTIIPNTQGSVTDLRQDRESIQVEYAHANKAAGAIPPTTFKEGEFYFCERVTIENCYFGKSDKAGSQMICIGQHGQNGKANCDYLTIKDNYFDDPYIKALGLLNYNHVQITGNTFYSAKASTVETTMIEMKIKQQGGSAYKYHEKEADEKVVRVAEAFEHAGMRKVSIRGNKFIITGNSNKRALSVVRSGGSVDYLPGAMTVENCFRRTGIPEADGGFSGAFYTGFLPVNNYVGDLDFSGNEITVDTAQSGMDDHTASIGVAVVGLTVKDNAVTGNFSDRWNGTPGLLVSAEPRGDAEVRGLAFKTDLRDRFVILPDGKGGTVRVRADGEAHWLRLLSDGHAHLTCTIDREHNAVVEILCDEGYTFSGWSAPLPATLTADETVTCRTKPL